MNRAVLLTARLGPLLLAAEREPLGRGAQFAVDAELDGQWREVRMCPRPAPPSSASAS